MLHILCLFICVHRNVLFVIIRVCTVILLTVWIIFHLSSKISFQKCFILFLWKLFSCVCANLFLNPNPFQLLVYFICNVVLCLISGRKPHCCHFCGKGFGSPAELKRHVRTHTGEKPFVCTECGRGFAQKGDMKKHIFIVHHLYWPKIKCWNVVKNIKNIVLLCIILVTQINTCRQLQRCVAQRKKHYLSYLATYRFRSMFFRKWLLIKLFKCMTKALFI